MSGLARLGLTVLSGAMRTRRVHHDLTTRLAAFPETLPVGTDIHIRWDDAQIPYVSAKSDRDGAVALGAIHAHLRLFQLEAMRRIAYGRISEVAGISAVDLDHTLRMVNFPRAVPDMMRAMRPEVREWLSGFVDGINATLAQTSDRPEEFRLFGMEPEPWTAEDVLVIGRLAAVDFSWRVWHRLLALRSRADWAHIWQRLADADLGLGEPESGTSVAAEMTEQVWAGLGRTGSNAVAVSAAKSSSGGALLASDPHLSIMLPASWLAVSLHTPGYNVCGLMIPGLPVVALGRNRDIAWSGTSLHAASSDLFDVTEVPGHEVRSRRERIGVRWAGEVEREVRETGHGPIVTDSPLLADPAGRDLALTWAGYLASDELGSMLDMMRATDWESFRSATQSFAVPAQNLVFADTSGQVGQLMAAQLPGRALQTPGDLALPAEAHSHWDRIFTGRDLPADYAPERGFVASANDRPLRETPVPVGFFFSPRERVSRIEDRLASGGEIDFAALAELHRDVAMPSSPDMRDLVVGLLEDAGFGDRRRGPGSSMLDALRKWDCAHSADSRGALAFELFLFHFVHKLHGDADFAIHRASLHPWKMLREDVAMVDGERLRAATRDAVRSASRAFRKYQSWGDLHRIRLSHPFSAIPFLRRRFMFTDAPVGGSNETVMKTAHGLSSGPHAVKFGANARFMADMSHPDRNRVVILGGQDGWLGSTTAADQFMPWQRGEYRELPLDPATAEATFPHVSVVRAAPAKG